MIHDVAWFARRSSAREEALSRVCAALAESGRLDDDAARVLSSVSANCASRAGLWQRREPDAAYIAVGRPDATGDGAVDDGNDPVLAELATPDDPDITVSLRAVARALDDLQSAYDAQASAVDDRLDPPTAQTLNLCRASVGDDRRALARPAG